MSPTLIVPAATDRTESQIVRVIAHGDAVLGSYGDDTRYRVALGGLREQRRRLGDDEETVFCGLAIYIAQLLREGARRG